MRSIARQSARLAKGRRAQQGARVQHAIASLSRDFHTSPHQRSQSPNDRPNHTRPITSPLEEQRRRETDATESEQQENHNESTKAVDDARKPLARKTLRQRRNALDAPPLPPPIPDWFLKYNVKLRVEKGRETSNAGSAKVLKCIDTQTGHTLFSFTTDETPVAKVAESGRPASMTFMPIRAKATDRKFFDHRFATSGDASPGPAAKATPKEKNRSKTGSTEKSSKVTSHVPNLEATNASSPGDGIEGGERKSSAEEEKLRNYLQWIMLEAEASIRAGMTITAESQQSSSFAASRVDLSLECPDPESHEQLDQMIEVLGNITDSDIIRIDANDFAELTSDYVGRDSDIPGSFSTLSYDVFDGYRAVRARHERMADEDEARDDEVDEMDEDEEEDNASNRRPAFMGFGSLDNFRKALRDKPDFLEKALSSITITGVTVGADPRSRSSSSGPRTANIMSSAADVTWDDARLIAVLDSLLDGPKIKRATKTNSTLEAEQSLGRFLPSSAPSTDDSPGISLATQLKAFASWPTHVNSLLRSPVETLCDEGLHLHNPFSWKDSNAECTASAKHTAARSSRTIVHLRDLKDICKRPLGSAMVRRLVRMVRKRRQAGEEVIVVGTSAYSVTSTDSELTAAASGLPFRSLTVPPLLHWAELTQSSVKPPTKPALIECITVPTYRRILEINLRHISRMLHRLRPAESLDLFTPSSLRQLSVSASRLLSEKVLTQDSVQRIVLTAIGLSQSHAQSQQIEAIHIGLADYIGENVENSSWQWAKFMDDRESGEKVKGANTSAGDGSSKEKVQARLDRLRRSCNPHETKLFTGVVDPQNIKVGFNEVHAAPETVESLKTLTSLSLSRPDAFKYGILAQDRLTGLMLYGPPGTGKTLLAKAVAKECKATVLEVSGAQIYDKYVGEGEKMVRAVFSLAKKLSPCIVFIDEADAIFGSRSNAGNRNTHRETINQFLREWDGMDLHNVFIMVATNRPFDVDDAVLRRLPRRVLVDLPVAKDRESILKIHLRDEQLDNTVSLSNLAEQTPFYSGSDLKNLCVSAALACVREETEAAKAHSEPEDFSFPEKRTLSIRHFEKAIKEISASISEDMSSLTAIRKFDEQYGDGRGKKTKHEYGFGLGDGRIDETAVRVRQSPPP